MADSGWPHNESRLQCYGSRRDKHPLIVPAKEKDPNKAGRPVPVGGAALYFFSFHFMCSMQLFTLSSESVSLPYLFLNLWAPVQTLTDLYLNVSSTLSRSHYSRASGFALSISFQNFLVALAAILSCFATPNYCTRVMMFLSADDMCPTMRNPAHIH